MGKNISDFQLVFIIILNWNSFEDTIGCINSCRGLLYPNFRILVVDNGSTDDSEVRLRSHFPGIEMIQTGANIGYAGGNNLGIRHAMKNGAEFIWVMNPDVKAEKASLGLLADVLNKDPSIGICGPRILQGSPQNGYCFDGLSIRPDRGYKPIFNATEDWLSEASSGLRDVDCVSGCSMFIRSALFRDIGLLREEFFLYYEDTEFNFRARKCGRKTVVCRQALVTHRKSPIINDVKRKQTTSYPHACRSSIIFARMQGKYVLKTAINAFGSGRLKGLLKKGCFIESLKYFTSRSKAVFSGLLTPIKPIERC